MGNESSPHSHSHKTIQYAPRVNSTGLKGRGAGWEVTTVQVCRSNYQLLLPLKSTHTHTYTEKKHPPKSYSLLISPHHTIKASLCSSTWSPAVEQRGRQVQEEKDQFDILFVLYPPLLSASQPLSCISSFFIWSEMATCVCGAIWRASDCYLTLKI